MATAAAIPMSQEASNCDEFSVQKSLFFSDCLKDLKNLRSQLYSAAEYFELSYTSDDQRQIVVETLKDYTVKAIVNTVDHLGSVTYKVNDFLDEKVEEVSGTELRVSCIDQRLRTCQEYIDHEGVSQQSLVINSPKYHKRYILPVGETTHGANCTKAKYVECSLDDEDEWLWFRNAVQATIRETPRSSVREAPRSFVRETPRSSVRETPRSSVSKGRSLSPSPRPPLRSATISLTTTMPKKEPEKRATSPSRFALLCSGSFTRPTNPNKSRPSTPNSAEAWPRYPSEPRKSASVRVQSERDYPKDVEQHPSKSKRLLKALLSRGKSKKDEMLYTYLDEY